MNQDTFNRIPVVKTVPADLDTPVSAYLKLANGPYSYLFESVQGGEKWGRYSIIGLPCREVYRVYGHQLQHYIDNELVLDQQVDNPLDYIDELHQSVKSPMLDDAPLVVGGLVGYFGHETIRYIEPRLANVEKPDPIGNPDILLMVSTEVLVFDNLSNKIHIVVLADTELPNALDLAKTRTEAIATELLQASIELPDESNARMSELVSLTSQEEHAAAVQRCKEYIRDGDLMQVVISRRMSADFTASPMSLYRALRSLNPSPYMFFLNLDELHVVGSSPEILVRVENQEITLRPIAGTRRRGVTPEEDQALEKELLADEKELAEHLMLIDLGRNDVGRVADVGTVKLTDKMIVERYSHVMHVVSNVVGQLNAELTPIDTLKATFPAGTLSGAPKIRALEIIDELEPVKRGVYGGAVGYLSWNGNMDTAIAIRTAVIKDEKIHIQAGGGIVADSVPQDEWEETVNKAMAVVRAAEQALDIAHNNSTSKQGKEQ